MIPFKKTDKGDLILHVFRPEDWKASDKRAAIVFFFGGGWQGGSPQQFYAHCAHLASKGMVAVSAQYRTKSSHGTDPFTCIADGKSAVRWLRQHATEQGIDPDRLAAGGGSAGGHVGACTGVLQGLDEKGEDLSISSVPNALVLFNPVIDTSEKGYGQKKLGDRWKEASPAHNVHKDVPPTLIFHGRSDTTVPYENVERFTAEMKKLGRRCELVGYDGQGHGFFNYGRPAYDDTIPKMDAFLTSLGFLPK